MRRGARVFEVLDDGAFGDATEVTPQFISPADPAARWTGAHGGQGFFAYAANYLGDVDHGIVWKSRRPPPSAKPR